MRLAPLLASIVFLAGGCGAADDEPAREGTEPRLVTFEEALEVADGTLVELGGAVYADERPMRVCRELAESYPPQCGTGIPVAGVTWDDLHRVQRASGVTWTDAPVYLTGEMRAGTLHVRDVSPWHSRPADEGPAPAAPGGDPEEPVSSDD